MKPRDITQGVEWHCVSANGGAVLLSLTAQQHGQKD